MLSAQFLGTMIVYPHAKLHTQCFRCHLPQVGGIRILRKVDICQTVRYRSSGITAAHNHRCRTSILRNTHPHFALMLCTLCK